MDKIEKIRQEIERRIEAIAKAPSDNGVMDSINGARGHELMRLLSFLDTLSEEPDIPEFPETFEICLYDGRTPDKEKCAECSTTCSVRKEEPDKSLEEAAEISFDEAGALTEDYRDFLAKGLTENKPRPIGPHWFCEYAKNRFIVGAEWQKSQMLKDAVEGEVTDVGINYLDLALFEAESLGLKDGDKVRIVVLKEEE